MNPRIEALLSHTAESALAVVPWPRPTAERLARARIVAHRGQRGARHVRENTFAAFDPTVAAGVAAIEFDIRYTRDHEPVVVHDADLTRVFGLSERIDETPWARLQKRAPELPHLADLVARYAPRTHLMIELKARGSETAEGRLRDILAPLTPARDFHILSLDTTLFAGVAALPPRCYLPVAKRNLGKLFQWALNNECAGLAGPHLLLNNRQIVRLRDERHFVGAGFVTRTSLLRREIARGVDWIFTNHPLRMQAELDKERARASA